MLAHMIEERENTQGAIANGVVAIAGTLNKDVANVQSAIGKSTMAVPLPP